MNAILPPAIASTRARPEYYACLRPGVATQIKHDRYAASCSTAICDEDEDVDEDEPDASEIILILPLS